MSQMFEPSNGAGLPVGNGRAAALRRNRSVRYLKVLLPVVALATVGYLGYWSWVHSTDQVVDAETVKTATKSDAPVVVDQVKFDGKDDKGRPYTVLADSASHPQGDSKHVTLVKPKADIIMSNGAYIALSADSGLLDREKDKVSLTGEVTMFHDNGLSFQTDAAEIDLKTKEAEGSAPVEGQNKDGELISDGFKVTEDGNVVLFTGKAYLKLYENKNAQTDEGGTAQ